MNNRKTENMPDDRKVNIKVKLALMWVALMFFYIYNDVFSMYQPGHVADLVEGHIEGVQFTPLLLFGAAVLMAFPSMMVLLSLTLRARANRIVNIAVGVFHIVVLVSTQFVGEGDTWLYWRLYELLEAIILVLIIWTSWKWPSSDSEHQ